jgi:cyclophilin family peptidyl-prolyl cis-trans isomerase
VEALRQTKARKATADQLAVTLDDAVGRINKAPAATPFAHVAREACVALAALEAPPAQVLPIVKRAVAALTPHRKLQRSALCACAVTQDALSAQNDAIEACSEGADEDLVERVRVQLVEAANISSKEKTAALAKLAKSDDLKVRTAVAGALAAQQQAGAELAAELLRTENDPGVASGLLEIFGNAELADALPDATLHELSKRFTAGTTFEQLLPLITVASLARSRDTELGRVIVETLSNHTDPAVRDAARGVTPGDREPGPRARPAKIADVYALPSKAKLRTSRGEIVITFEREVAPAAVQSFAQLARSKYYDGTPFHRVIADFVTQGGDKRGDGNGGPGYTLACESSDLSYVRGAVGIATSGHDTGGSQFFLTHSWHPHLDGRYTLFAHVDSGLDVMDAIQPDDTLLGVELVEEE